MKAKKFATLITVFSLGLNAALPIPAALASEIIPIIKEEEDSSAEKLSYRKIGYDGEEHTIIFEENKELTLLGWKDDGKEIILAEFVYVDEEGEQTVQKLELSVKDEVQKHQLENQEILRFLVTEDTAFSEQLITPLLTEKSFVLIETKENGTSKEEAVFQDEAGVILKRTGIFRYLKETEEETLEITEEEYVAENTSQEEEAEIPEEPKESPKVETEEESETEEHLKTEENDTVGEEAETAEIEEAEPNVFSLQSMRAAVSIPSISYSTHIQKNGWSTEAKDGATSGTQGDSLRLESIKIKVNGIEDLGVAYSTHIQKQGWSNFVADGKESGTTGQSKRLEAIKIQLTGKNAAKYDVYYRVHAQSYGWMGWTKNGEPAGTEGLAKRLEAIEILILEKGSSAPGPMENSFMDITSKPSAPDISEPVIAYSSYIEGTGWQTTVKNGALSGTEGVKKKLEAVRIGIENIPGLNVRYSTHMQSKGWLDWVDGAGISGMPGQNKRLEAIKIELVGKNASKYDIYYRMHSQKFGWLGWAKNGESAGTEGYGFQAEAMEIRVVPKGASFDRGPQAYRVKDDTSIVYSSHIQSLGWLSPVKNGKVTGTQNKALRMEALKVSLENNQYSGGVSYQTHVETYGWMKEAENGGISGTTGQAKRVEAVRLNLTGDIAQHYDIYYRAYVQSYGWLGWAKNGMNAGTEGMQKRMESLEIKLVEKGLPAPAVSEAKAFRKGEPIQKKVIFLDPGHGGADSGTVHYGVMEKDLNLQVSMILKKDLEKAGYTVIMARNSDVYLDHKTGRSAMANATNANLFISVHHNSMPFNDSVKGIETFYYEYDPDYPPVINGALHNNPTRLQESARLAQSVQSSLISATGAVDRKVQRDTFAVLRETSIPAILVELGFMSNREELNKLTTSSYQNLLSKAITNGVNKYFKK